MRKRNWLFLVILTLSTLSTGCLFSQNKIVYAGFAQEVIGSVRVATNKQIPVTVDGVASTMDIGGMYIIKGADLKLLIRKANENSH